MAIKNDRYTYRVTWSSDDDEYVGLCAELPSLSWLAKTPESALKGIRDIVADVIEDMKSNKEKIPEPIAIKNYRGNLWFVFLLMSIVHLLLKQQKPVLV